MRFLTAVLFSAFCSTVWAGKPVQEIVDLDQPGSLQRLRLQRPDDYRAVTAVLVSTTRRPCMDDKPRTLEKLYKVRNIECGLMILRTSYPASGWETLYFSIGNTRYSTRMPVLVE